LLAGDEPDLQPAVNCRGDEAEDLGGFRDRDKLTVDRVAARVVAWDVAVAAHAADDLGSEPLAGC
jgi:hypothetical protein